LTCGPGFLALPSGDTIPIRGIFLTGCASAAAQIEKSDMPTAAANLILSFEFMLPLNFKNYYLITRSARASMFGGIVSPICFAVFKLITSSNFAGCSNGRSALYRIRGFSARDAAQRPCHFCAGGSPVSSSGIIGCF
jgi:hypothetical protein